MAKASQVAVPEQTGLSPAEAKAELRKMTGELRGWLKFRDRNNAVAAGKVKGKVPPGLAKKLLSESRDWQLEQRLATRMHWLLSQIFDAGQLPNPDIQKDPDAAIKLARIVVSGKLPDQAVAPSEQGLIWFWPAAIVFGAVMLTVMYKIRSDAALAEEKERIECIKLGACTDYGFWLKVGGVAVFAWLAWDKFGLREVAGRSRSKARGG